MSQTLEALQREAIELDTRDPLRDLRAHFHLPVDSQGRALTYLCGHSLGLQPKGVAALVEQELRAWRESGVEAHFSGERPWVSYHERLIAPLARLVGAEPTEVVAMNSLTVNLHLGLVSFYRPTRERYKILIERDAFPSDRYAVVSHLRWHGFDPQEALIEAAPRPGESTLRQEDLAALIDLQGPSIALVFLPGVHYLTGQRFDITAVSAVARRQGCTIGVDLAHAIGNVPLTLHDSEVDFAVWCGYKYLNGGPGAIGGLFVHARHGNAVDLPRFAGWWGHDKRSRFSMPHDFVPLAGAEGWQLSNPPILAMAPLLASLELFERVGMPALRKKSLQLTAYLQRALAGYLHERIVVLTPSEPEAHGSQLSLRLDRQRASELPERLRAAGIVCDWREPNVLRLALVPLYNTFAEAWHLASVLKELLID